MIIFLIENFLPLLNLLEILKYISSENVSSDSNHIL